MLTLAIVFVALAIFVHYHSVLRSDVIFSKDLQSEGDTSFRRTLIFDTLSDVSLLGQPLISGILVAFFALLFGLYNYYREAILIILTPASVIINSVAKIIVNRPRPTVNLVHIFVMETDKSFPSGHVSFYTVFFGFIFFALFFTPRIPKSIRYLIQTISLFLIITISISRVYLGAHFVTDTIGGYLLGLIILIGFLYIYFKPKIFSHN